MLNYPRALDKLGVWVRWAARFGFVLQELIHEHHSASE